MTTPPQSPQEPARTPAQSSFGSPRKGMIIASILAIIILAVGGFFFIQSDAEPSGSEASSVSSSSTPTKATPSDTVAPTPSISEEPRKEADNSGAAPATVGTFSMDGPATITGATYDSMPYVLPLNPAGPQESMVRWVQGLGQDPTHAADGTVYVLGHAWGQQKLVFNPISETVTASVDTSNPDYINGTDNMPVSRLESNVLNGSHITMTDAEGNSRTWTVSRSWLVGKNDAIADPDVMAEDRPGRIILIACSVSGSNDLGYNVVVEGFLD